MPQLICTEPVCRHEWTEPTDPTQPRCPRCGGFWVRVVPVPGEERPHAPRHHARAHGRARRSIAAR
jgi:hypothetical protein